MCSMFIIKEEIQNAFLCACKMQLHHSRQMWLNVCHVEFILHSGVETFIAVLNIFMHFMGYEINEISIFNYMKNDTQNRMFEGGENTHMHVTREYF